MQIQYVGFQSNARSKDYRYLVTDRKAEPREFVFSISLRALAEGRISYQDVARMCDEKLQESLSQETVERPLPLDASVSDQDLDDYRERHSPPTRRQSIYRPSRRRNKRSGSNRNR